MSSTAQIKRVLERDGGRCVIAGPRCVGEATVADHRANRGQGGSTVLDNYANLIAACTLCNGWKEDVTGADRIRLLTRGVRVEKGSTNQATLTRCLLTAVTYPDGSLWWLTTDGRRETGDIPPF